MSFCHFQRFKKTYSNNFVILQYIQHWLANIPSSCTMMATELHNERTNFFNDRRVLFKTDLIVISNNGCCFNIKMPSNQFSYLHYKAVVYKSNHRVSLRNHFLLKRYVFLKNIVLHNVMCETNWTVTRKTNVKNLRERLKRTL